MKSVKYPLCGMFLRQKFSRLRHANSDRGRRFQSTYISWRRVLFLARRRWENIWTPISGRGKQFQLIYISWSHIIFLARRSLEKIWGSNSVHGRRFQLINFLKAVPRNSSRPKSPPRDALRPKFLPTGRFASQISLQRETSDPKSSPYGTLRVPNLLLRDASRPHNPYYGTLRVPFFLFFSFEKTKTMGGGEGDSPNCYKLGDFWIFKPCFFFHLGMNSKMFFWTTKLHLPPSQFSMKNDCNWKKSRIND